MRKRTGVAGRPRPDPMTVSSGESGISFLFDLDGILVDSVYQHVLAWREGLEAIGVGLSVWRIHRKIGMSGGLLTHALLREIGRPVSGDEVAQIQKTHREAYLRLASQLRPLPGAKELLDTLTASNIPCAIATSGGKESARAALEALNPAPSRNETSPAR